MTCSAAARAGVPAVIAEAGGCGQLREEDVAMLVAGVRNALRVLEMLPGEIEPPAREQRVIGAFDWLRCREAGWWEAEVRVGDEVAGGTLLGRVKNLWGDVQEEIRAPRDGVLLFLTTSAAVADDGLLLGLGAELAPLG